MNPDAVRIGGIVFVERIDDDGQRVLAHEVTR